MAAQTAIAARELGYKVTVLALACVDETDERVALDYLERVVGVRVERTSTRAGALA